MAFRFMRRPPTKLRRTSPWRLIAYEVAIAAILAVIIGVVTTALDFGGMRLPLGRPFALDSTDPVVGAAVLMGFVAVVVVVVVAIRESSLWKQQY